jgi:predicted nucleic acid-binding protein
VLVVDTSAVVGVLIGRPRNRRLVDRLGVDGDLHAPHLLDVEFLHTLRRLVSTGQLGDDRAADARTDFADLTIVRYQHTVLADRVWELRHNLSAYDATFVALSEALGVPLITCDTRLAKASDHHSAQVELFEDEDG